MAQLDFSLGAPRTEINLAPAIQNYFSISDRIRKREDDDRERKAKEAQAQIWKGGFNPQTQQMDYSRVAKNAFKSGDIGLAQDAMRLRNEDFKFKQNQAVQEQNRQQGFRKQLGIESDKYYRTKDPLARQVIMSEGINKAAQNLGIDITQMQPAQRKEFISANRSLKAIESDEKRLDREFKREQVRKKAFREDEDRLLKTEDRLLEDDFRSKFIPTLDIGNLSSNKNARNQLIKKISGSKYGGTKGAQDLMSNLKGKGSNIFEKLALQQQLYDQEKSRGGSFKPSQYQAATYGGRLEDAHKIMEDIYASGYDRTALRERAENFLPNEARSANRKRIDQSERNFATALLRPESGASIAESEFETVEKQYFSRPGDSKAVLKQKKQNRARAIAGQKAAAGGAWEETKKIAQEYNIRDSAPKPAVSLFTKEKKTRLEMLRAKYNR